MQKADLHGRAYVSDHRTEVTGRLRGAVSFHSGELRFGRRIEDAFIIVNAGAPDVTVYHENRNVGKTDQNGRLMIAGIRSYEPNSVSINPIDLPLYSTVNQVKRTVIASAHSGVEVNFVGKKANYKQISLNLVDASGKQLAPGTIAKINGDDEEHIVGYDGQLFVLTKTRQALITVQHQNGSCVSAIDLGDKKGPLFDLGETVCSKV